MRTARKGGWMNGTFGECVGSRKKKLRLKAVSETQKKSQMSTESIKTVDTKKERIRTAVAH